MHKLVAGAAQIAVVVKKCAGLAPSWSLLEDELARLQERLNAPHATETYVVSGIRSTRSRALVWIKTDRTLRLP